MQKIEAKIVKSFLREIDSIYKKKDFNFNDYDIISKKYQDLGINRFSENLFFNKDNENFSLDFEFVRDNDYTFEELSDILDISIEEVENQFNILV